MDNDLHAEPHLYRKHLHIRISASYARMLIFLIAFVSFRLK